MAAIVTHIKQDALELVSDLPELIKSGEVTHLFCVLRMGDGRIRYKAVGINDSTYLVGMIEKAKVAFLDEHGWETV